MSNKKSGTLWIKTNAGSWGAFDWKVLREWFVLKWLPPETEVSEEKEGSWQQAQSLTKLWAGTQATSKRIEEFEIADLESKKLPISPALSKRITELGWPGNVKLLQNYYWGNKLREQLESLFPDASRSVFDDPDWPKCWSWLSPAEESRQEQSRLNEPLTLAQSEVLMFFIGANHGIVTKSDAADKIEGLLEDPENDARWEDHKLKVPATEKQKDRLKWWAKKLGRRLPTPLMKAQASQLIDQWLEDHPELEPEWYEHKDRSEEFEIELWSIADDVDEWREFYDCKKVSEKRVRNVLEVAGSRKAGEQLDQFMNRFFAELRRQEPSLFGGRRAVARIRKSTKPKGGCLVLCIAFFVLIVGIVSTLAAHFSK
jgi:hypothetical protein